MRIAMALLALALATTGCKKKENKPTTETGSGSAMAGSDMAGSGSAAAGSGSAGSAMAGSDTGSGSAAMAGSGSAAGSGADATKMAHKAENCPSTIAGATTKADLKGKTVVVSITSTDKKAVAEIQKKVDALVAEKKTAKKGAGHDQKGTHGGDEGLCPVYVPDGATAAAKKEKNGSSVTITPKDKPDDLKKQIDDRITKAADWMKANPPAEGAGAGAGSAAGAGSGGGTGSDTGGGGGKGTGGGSGKGAGKAKAKAGAK